MSAIRRRGDRLRWRLHRVHHRIVVDLLQQLDDAIDGPVDDPVVRRLFPRVLDDEDDDEEAELRMLLAGDLLLRRHEAIRMVLEVLRRAEDRERRAGTLEVELRDEEPAMLLAVLNDVRLAIGARIGTTAVELRQLVDPDDEVTIRLLDVMDTLAWFQMQLLEHIDPVAARHDEPD